MRSHCMLYINGVKFMSNNFIKKHIIKCFYNTSNTTWTFSFSNSHFKDIHWRRAWLVPFKCIYQTHLENYISILHNIYPTNIYLSRFLETDGKCSFCKTEKEDDVHLFCKCSFCEMWKMSYTIFIY